MGGLLSRPVKRVRADVERSNCVVTQNEDHAQVGSHDDGINRLFGAGGEGVDFVGAETRVERIPFEDLPSLYRGLLLRWGELAVAPPEPGQSLEMIHGGSGGRLVEMFVGDGDALAFAQFVQGFEKAVRHFLVLDAPDVFDDTGALVWRQSLNFRDDLRSGHVRGLFTPVVPGCKGGLQAVALNVKCLAVGRHTRPRINMSTKTERKSTRYGGDRGGNILEFYTEEFRPEPSPVELFRQHVIQWFLAAKTLRQFETMRLTDRPTAEDLASHRMICSALIAFGEFASHYARQLKNEVNLEAVGLSVECIEAETRLLHDNFRMFHDNTLASSEAEALLKEAFNEA